MRARRKRLCIDCTTGNEQYLVSLFLSCTTDPKRATAFFSVKPGKGNSNDLLYKGVPSENIYFAGFSQGACLTLEFVTRNADKYGGVAAFAGGLIGDKIYSENYKGDFQNTPVFIGTSDPDPHIPVERIYATTNILKGMNAAVTEKIYTNMGYTINQDEIDKVNKLIFTT